MDMDIKTGLFGVMLVVLLALAGCVSGDPADTAATDGAETPAAGETVSSDEEAPGVSEQDGPVLSDEDVMATMTCEMLADDQLDALELFGVFNRGARVEIGESDGVTWWAVVLERTGDDGSIGARRSFITKSPTLDDFSEGSWIELPSENTWQNVDWDHDMLVRGQSALALARRTLASS